MPTLTNFAERLFLPGLGSAVKKFAYGQESVDLARVAIALERYRLAHGEYPESLDALAPQFMTSCRTTSSTASRCIIAGRPMASLCFIPSAGMKLTMAAWLSLDKGSSSRVDINHGDWVWSSSAVRN